MLLPVCSRDANFLSVCAEETRRSHIVIFVFVHSSIVVLIILEVIYKVKAQQMIMVLLQVPLVD